jgi:hypothetical protein
MWLLGMLACSAPPSGPFSTPDDACWDRVPGASNATQGAEEAVQRYSCYRNFVGQTIPKIDRSLQTAAHAHARYLATNDATGDEEDPSNPEFTGVDSNQRVTAAGYLYSYPFWPVTQEINEPPTEIIDTWVNDGFAREIVMTPGVVHAGFAQVQGRVSALFAFPFPVPSPPIVYPADGQIDVPLGYFDQPFGYPISISVGSASTTDRISNVYDLRVLGFDLVGPTGSVPMEPAFVPEGEVDAGLLLSAVFVPSEPLEPSSTYAFSASIAWIDGTAEVRSTFTTRGDL